MKYLVEVEVNGFEGIAPVLEMYDLHAEQTFDKDKAVSMVIDGPGGPVAIEVPCPQAIHTLQ